MHTIDIHHYPMIALVGCAAAAVFGAATPHLDPATMQMRQRIALENCLRAEALTSVERDALGDAILRANASGQTLQFCPAGYVGGRPATAATAGEILGTLSHDFSPRAVIAGR